MVLDERLRKALVNNRNQMRSTRINQAYKYAQEHNIQATKKSILQYIKEIELIKPFKGNKANKQFVFHYIGGWFADIGFNRNKEMGQKIDGDNWLKQFVLFVNGNSGWAKVYEAPNKSREVVSSIVERFIRDMKDYPVKRIITDNDGCFDDKNLPIMKVQSEIANNAELEHKNHRLFARIDTFMSHLRSYAWKEYNVGTVNGKKAKICDQPPDKEFYIPFDTIQRFVFEWNEHVIPIVRCTRNEMMKDRNLELAYMCWALYGNETKDVLRKAIQGEVKLKSRVAANDLGANRQERAHGERAGTYVITKTQDGHYIGIDKNQRQVHFNANEVTNIVDEQTIFNEGNKLKDVEDLINTDDKYQGMISRYNGPKVNLNSVENPSVPLKVSQESSKPKPVEPEKPKKPEKPEPTEEDAAMKMAIDSQLRDLERGIFPELSAERLYNIAKVMAKALKQADAVQYSAFVEEVTPKTYKVSQKEEEKLAKRLKRKATKEEKLYLTQDIPIEDAYNEGNVTKLANQIKERNGAGPNKKENNSTGKQTKSQRRQYRRRS